MLYITKRTLILIEIITFIGNGIMIPIIAASSDNLQETKYFQPVVCNLDFSKFVQLTGDIRIEEYHTGGIELLLDYRDYAPSYETFNEKYPFFTINTNGIAISNSTFGDVGKNKFGKLYFATKNFKAESSGYYFDIVNASSKKKNEYEVNVKISIGFKLHDSYLFLIPKISGSLKSLDGRSRYLQFGLTLSSINFIYKQ